MALRRESQRSIERAVGETINKGPTEHTPQPFTGLVISSDEIAYKQLAHTTIAFDLGSPNMRTTWDVQDAFLSVTSVELFKNVVEKEDNLILNIALLAGNRKVEVTKVQFNYPKEFSKNFKLGPKLISLELFAPLSLTRAEPLQIEFSYESEKGEEGGEAIILKEPVVIIVYNQIF